MLRIAIVIGSTRPGRIGAGVGKWVHEVAATRTDAEFELVDLADQDLPLLDEPIPPSQGKYSQPHTKRWAEKVASFDGFVFVTPEYNHATSGALKNALDFLYAEWNNKAAGFVGYGAAMGTRAVENLRLVCAELQMATVRNQVLLSLREDFEGYQRFQPQPHQEKALHGMLDQLIPWAQALQTVRGNRGKDTPAEPKAAQPGAGGGHGEEHSRPPRPGTQERTTHPRAERKGTPA